MMDLRAGVALSVGMVFGFGAAAQDFLKLPDVVARHSERLSDAETRIANLQASDGSHATLIERNGLRVTIVSDDVEELEEVVQGALRQIERLDERTRQQGRGND